VSDSLEDALDLYGVKRTLELDEGEGRFVFHATQDVEPILNRNKELFGDPGRGYTPSKDMRYVAEIPLIVAEDWKNRLGVDVFNKDHAGGRASAPE
jgi:hypothetical protein